MKIFKSPLTIEVAIQQPPCKRFSQLDNVVKGYFVAEFSEPTDVLSIEYGFKGTVSASYKRVYVDFNYALNQPQYHRITLHDEYTLFDHLYSISDFVPVGEPYHLVEGDKIKCPISITIPDDIYLPSSTDEFGSNADNKGKIKVSYQIYVKINRKSTVFDQEKIQYWYHSIVYQASLGRVLDDYENKAVICTVHDTFKNKVKKFYYDEKLAALIPNNMERGHTHSRCIIQLWNPNYRKDNYMKLTKNIDITVSLTLGKYLFINLPLFDQISMHLCSGLYSGDSDGNCSKDFQFNGQSTKLGYFKLKKISISLNTLCKLRVQRSGCKMSLSKKLVELPIDNISFDIKNFKYDKDSMMFAENILGEELLSISKKSLMSLMNEKDTIMPTCQLGDYFTNESTLEFQIVIGDDTDSNNLTYKFSTEVTPELLITSKVKNFNANLQLDKKDKLINTDETPPAYNEIVEILEKSQFKGVII